MALRAWSVAVLCLAVTQAAVLRQQGEHATTKNVANKANFLNAGRFEPPWEDSSHHASTRLKCGITEQVGAHTDKYEDCPATCPYFAQNRKDTQHCTFLCVPGNECGQWNPNKPIPDSIKNTKTCRGPKVAFCNTAALDGTDTCVKCMRGYALHDGQCYFEYWNTIIGVGLVFVVIMTVVVGWFVDLCCRTPCNDESVRQAEMWRSRSKVMDTSDKRHPQVYPTYSTDTCNDDVAGPGMVLHFRFQRFFIIWPFVVAVAWTLIACFEPDLFILGTRKFGTPRHNCILVAWGYETQQRLMWTKVLFCAIVYVGSFISFLWFSVDQRKTYNRMDVNGTSMKDFALELKGLPEMPGTDKDIETNLKSAVEKAFGSEKVVGVSIAWDYCEDVDETLAERVDKACANDLFERQMEWEIEQKTGKKPARKEVELKVKEEKEKADKDDPTKDYGSLRKWMYETEKSWLGPDEDKDNDETLVQMLNELKTSDCAYVVFKTYQDMNLAFDSEVGQNGFDFTYAGEVKHLTFEKVANEPCNINWHNFGSPDPNLALMKFFKGFFTVYVPALLIWFFAFYVPYAWSLYNFNYDNGAELPGYYSIIFTIVVCGGNATMYVVCDICCDMIGFRYKDTKQVTYMLMYLVACMINVFLDMIVTYYTALKVMVGLDFRTYHGTRLADIEPFTEQFETYAMQRSLGANTYAYAWPSTFFLCFVIEPVVTILAPYQICKVLVRTHSEIRGTCAEAYLMAFEFDLGRYADILLNVFLGILIFYFPGGYIWTLFYFMCFSHCFIYCFDHWRTLNVIPLVRIVSMEVDWWAQVTMGFNCSIIIACMVFKANCETYVNYCLTDLPLVGICTIAGVAHFIVHTALLCFLVPKLAGKVEVGDKINDQMLFSSKAEDEPRTWFSVNPVHCLRTKYIHASEDERKAGKYCRLAAWGKEHLLEKNDKLNCHFERVAAVCESYDFRKSIAATFKKKHTEEDDEANKA